MKKIEDFNKLKEWCLTHLNNSLSIDKLDVLSKLTVVIPSYNRQSFILRQIAYWSNSPVQVVILDGSYKSIDVEITAALKLSPQFTYVHDTVGMVERLAIGQEYINTSYAVLLGDDEFHLKNGLRKAINKLEIEKEFGGCIGQSIRFYPATTLDKMVYGTGYKHFGFEAASDSVKDRLLFSLENYNAATCYAVLRKDVWKNSWGSLLKTSCKDVCEIQQAITTHILGKFTTVEEIYWLRSDENVSVLDENDYIDLSFPIWWVSPKYAVERKDLINTLVKLMIGYTRENEINSKKIVIDAFETYFKFISNQNKNLQGVSVVKVKGIISSIARKLLGVGMYNKLKNTLLKPKIYQFNADLGTRKELYLDEFKNLFRYNSKAEQELNEVESLVFDFYKTTEKV